MADNLKFLEREILNKVLNAGEDALNVDLTAGGSAMLVDDAAFTPGTSTVQMVGAEFDDTGPDSVDEGDAGAIRMSANRNLYTTIRDAAGNERGVNVNSSSQLLVDGSGVTQPVSGTVSVSGLLADGHAVTIDNTDSNEVYVRGSGTAGSADDKVLTVQGIASGTALAVTESSPISGFATSANQLAAGHTIDCNSTFVKLKDGSGTSVTSNSGKLDVCLHSEDGTAINETANALDVNIASGGFDGVVTNGGTFAVQVDGSALTALQLIDDTVATLGTTTYTEETTKGNVVGAVRNDTLATLADTDNEIAPLQVNKSGALYTVEETGQLGAIYESGTTAVSGEQIIAIQFLEDTKFTTLTPASAAFIGTASGDGDNIVNTEVFPQGMTIFGRWTAFTLVTGGRVIAYKGVW